MSKTHRKEPAPKPKPRQIKRQRQQEAMQPQPLEYPQRLEPVTHKPMG
jgi:hypothetical protein